MTFEVSTHTAWGTACHAVVSPNQRLCIWQELKGHWLPSQGCNCSLYAGCLWIDPWEGCQQFCDNLRVIHEHTDVLWRMPPTQNFRGLDILVGRSNK